MQKGQKWPNVSIPKSSVGEPVVIVDPRYDIQIGF